MKASQKSAPGPDLPKDTLRRAIFRHRTSTDPSIPMEANSLRKIPCELRQRIFYLTGVTKGTLAALVGDEVIYKEVLRVYWEETRFRLPYAGDHGTLLRDSPLSETSLNSIKKISIPLHFLCGGKTKSRVLVKQLVGLNITDLRVSLIPDPSIDVFAEYGMPYKSSCRVHERARDCFAAFEGTSPGLRTFSLEWRGDLRLHERYAIFQLNIVFGIKAKLRSVNTGTAPTVFFWEDSDGHNLSWCKGDPDHLPQVPGIFSRPIEGTLKLKYSPFFRRMGTQAISTD